MCEKLIMYKKTTLYSILLFFFLLNSSFLFGQEPYYWQLTDDDGLPSMTVYKILQDRNGLIWIATSNGLCNYDGKKITKCDGALLNDQEILKIEEGADGNIWGMNLSGQLFKNQNGVMGVVDSLNDNKIIQVRDFEWVGDKLYIANYIPKKQSYTFTKKGEVGYIGQLISYNYLFNTCYTKICPVKNGTILLYIDLSEGDDNTLLYSMYNADYANFGILRQNSADSIFFFMEKKQMGKILSFSWNNHFFLGLKSKLYSSSFKNASDLSVFSSEPIITIEKNKNELFLILTNGIKIINKDKKDTLIFKDIRFNSAFRDRENNLWLGTNGIGILIVPNLNTAILNKTNSILKGNAIYSLSKINNDFVLIGKNDNTITKFSKKTLTNYTSPLAGRIYSIIPSLRGGFDIGSDRGYYHFDGQKYKQLFPGSYKSIFLSSKKEIYIGTSINFSLIYPKAKNISNLRTYGITESRNGMIWVGTTTGIFTYDGTAFIPFKDKNNKEQVPYNVTAMSNDTTGRIWATTNGHGVVMIRNGVVEKILDKRSGMVTNTFKCIFTENNYAWLGSDEGIYRYDINTHEIFYINKYNGLPTNEILSLCTNENALLIGTLKGLIVMPFETMQDNKIAPNIHLTSLLINEKVQNWQNTAFELSYKENNIAINFISYQYRARGDAKYEYRILELDTNWTMTEARNLRFANLSAGNYHFELRAVNESGMRSEKNIALYFHIEKPFWLQWWFLISILGVGVGSVAWFLKRRYAYQSKIDDLRMQALQAQMNPHFIFNALNAIQHFLTVNDEDNAVKFLSKFARLIRIVFEYNKKKEITFAEEVEMLNIYLSLEKLRFKDKVELHLNVSEALAQKQENTYLPPLLIQPIVENAFKHGLFHKEQKGNLWISFDLTKENHLKCVIEDDGVGRLRAEELSRWKSKHTSSGVAHTEERIKFWHEKGQTNIQNYLTVEDLYENNQAKGTRVTIIL